MIGALFFLIPLAMAATMALWLRHARQTGGRRWIGHWLASLAPMALLAGLHGLGLVTDGLATALIVPSVLGVAAFAGGALYLASPALIPVLLACMAWVPRALAEGIIDIKGTVTKWYESEPRREDDCEDQDHADAVCGIYHYGNEHLRGMYDDK